MDKDLQSRLVRGEKTSACDIPKRFRHHDYTSKSTDNYYSNGKHCSAHVIDHSSSKCSDPGSSAAAAAHTNHTQIYHTDPDIMK